MDLLLPPKLKLREGWASVKKVQILHFQSNSPSVGEWRMWIYAPQASVNGHLMSRTSQRDWELCASLGSACSQSANWESAGAEHMSHKNIRGVWIYKAKSPPADFIPSSLVVGFSTQSWQPGSEQQWGAPAPWGMWCAQTVGFIDGIWCKCWLKTEHLVGFEPLICCSFLWEVLKVLFWITCFPSCGYHCGFHAH